MSFSKYFCLFTLFFCFNLRSEVSGGSINMTVGSDMVNDDKMVGVEINLQCGGKFTGKGYLEAPIINITATKFDFTGTIKCGGKCIITVKEPFNQKMFKRLGKGEFLIKIDPSLEIKQNMPDFKKYSELSDSLSKKIESLKPSFNKVEPVNNENKKVIKIGDITISFSGELACEIVEAIENNNLNQVKYLLDQNKRHLKSNHLDFGSSGFLTSCMLMAGLYNYLDIAQELINQGASVDPGLAFSSSDECNPIICAIRFKNHRFLSLLLKNGADPNKRIKWATPVLIYAVLENDINCVKELVSSKGIKIDDIDLTSSTALTHAVGKGYVEIVKLLLEHGANPSHRAFWLLPLDYTVGDNKHEIAELIRKKIIEQQQKSVQDQSISKTDFNNQREDTKAEVNEVHDKKEINVYKSYPEIIKDRISKTTKNDIVAGIIIICLGYDALTRFIKPSYS